MSLAQYKFQSWLRNGIGNAITDVDTLDSGGVPGGHASIPVPLTVNKTVKTVTRNFPIVGAADIMGLSNELVIRTEPVNWNTNFPPNYLAHIEFYDEDLPWRYTPARAADQKLRPWISLIVLEETEFEATDTLVPLPQIRLKNALLPPYTETWLWAQVQTIVSSSLTADQSQPDHVTSRLICPRKLKTNTAYHAFVIPTFESGRVAGLGGTEGAIKLVNSLDPAWGLTTPLPLPDYPSRDLFPVYYEWYFHTGNDSDFEYLASLLKPRFCDPWVGRKPLNCSHPGFGIPDYDHPFKLYFEGALKSPQVPADAAAIPVNQADLTSFGTNLQTQLNAANQPGADPVVTPPFYGQKHILEDSLLLTPNATWIHELNRDPRWRVPAGFGGLIMRRYQDRYMQKAWEQVETIIEANKIITAAASTLAVSQSLYKNHIAALPYHDLASLTSPVHVKILLKIDTNNYKTLAQLFKESCFNGSVYGSAFRRLLRKRGPFTKKLQSQGVKIAFDQLEQLIISKSGKDYYKNYLLQEKKSPGLIAIQRLNFNVQVSAKSIFSMSLREKRPGDKDIESFYTSQQLVTTDLQSLVKKFAVLINPTNQESTTVCNPATPVFAASIIDPAVTIRARLSNMVTMPQAGWFDPPANAPVKFKQALAFPDFEDPMWEKLKELSTEWLIPNLHLLPNNTITLLQPNRKFIESFMVGLNVEMNREMLWREYPTDERGSCFRQFWNVNSIRDITGGSPQVNATIVEQFKDITPIHTWKNQSPTDPTDQRLGSHNKRETVAESDQVVLALRGDLFKCFPNLSVYAAKASVIIDGHTTIKKIKAPPVHIVGTITTLYSANGCYKLTMQADGNLVMYDYHGIAIWSTQTNGKGAVRCEMQMDGNLVLYDNLGNAVWNTVTQNHAGAYLVLQDDRNLVIYDVNGAEIWNSQTSIPTHTEDNIRFPIFKADIGVDVKFLGFDFTKAEVNGNGTPDNPGWFFILQETPGETRFGLDINSSIGDPLVVNAQFTWDDASWSLLPGENYIRGSLHNPALNPKSVLDSFIENKLTPAAKNSASWGASSADMAYILYQKPVMIAIHASEMLAGV